MTKIHPLTSPRKFIDKIYDVSVVQDIVYGFGGVGYVAGQGASIHRALKLDVYRPIDDPALSRPALILAFGGGFHHGSKGLESPEAGDTSTSMAEYCREFARRGYVCFSIEYRLMQEDPDPGVTPFLQPGQSQNRDRIDAVRATLGLPPCTAEMMRHTLEATTDDMTAAVNFVRTQSDRFGVDVARVAIGGFSAGAAIAMHSAFAEHAPVAAVICLSGRIAEETMRAHLKPRATLPAAFVAHGDQDLPFILSGVLELQAHFERAGVANRFVSVANSGHYYSRDAIADDGLHNRGTSVEDSLAGFLHSMFAAG